MSIRQTELIDSFKAHFTAHREQGRNSLVVASYAAKLKSDLLATRASTAVLEARSSPVALQYSLQRKIRPAYGKGDVRRVTIGDHPDFAELAGTTETMTCPIITLFMDIESSTRLELLYEPAEVAKIKNAFLCTAIELIHAFDGHVHRLQGDAVMAFFGGVAARPENAAVDAINCASVLWLFVKSYVIPTLKDEGFNEEFGIRIGVDYAPDAHWSAFGFPGVDEVTATGFGVSAAAKLQHSAGRNQIMLGQHLVEFLDLPDVVTKIKEVQREGECEAEPFLIPNITTRDGKPHNYRKALLRAEEYLRCGPLAEAAAQFIGEKRLQPIRLAMVLCKEKGGSPLGNYSAASLILPKEHWIRFDLSLPFQHMFPYTVKFDVENHGREALLRGGEFLGNHQTEKTVSNASQHSNLVHWESTAYRGLHYMTIVVYNASGVLARRRVGVYVE